MINKRILKTLLLALFIAGVFLNVSVLGQDSSLYDESSQAPGFYTHLTDFLRNERETFRSSTLDYKDFAIIFAVDLPLSMLCFWLAMWMVTKSKLFSPKRHLWFLLIFNLAWFIMLACYKFCWEILSFLIVRIRPDLREPMIEGFTVFVLVGAILIYIWLIARTFTTGFTPSILIAVVFHALYFAVIFCVMLAAPKENQFFDLTRKNLGARAVVRSYISDVDKITSGLPMPAFLRFRPYHL